MRDPLAYAAPQASDTAGSPDAPAVTDAPHTPPAAHEPHTRLAALAEAPRGFEFYAALRLIEAAYPGSPRLGRSQRVADDPVRLAQAVTLAFEPAMIEKLEWRGGSAPRLEVNFLGLSGPNGPLPLHLTEYIRDRVRNSSDPTMARFLDVFHHRMLSLFYRAWASAQPSVSLDRPDADRFAGYIASLIGTGMASLQHRSALPEVAKLHYAGRLADQRRNAEGLAALLADFFGVAVRVEPFVGHWMRLPADERTRLKSGIAAERLGVSTVLGSAVWNVQHKFRLRIGPLDYEQFRAFLPGGANLRRLIDWVRQYVGDTLAWDVRLVLKKEQVPRLRLGRTARLGYTTWVAGQLLTRDAEQLLFDPVAAHS
ncbi:type VI secretion system baseplate subunit TssG [Paraburkholderia ginsengiterrae]|uniref:type VI secretion system baseplate subunit TssG n=1 Tax=Paraburkholderia ginsengiterrae TaxID=1462993 RepID=UPI0009ED31AA|nr:type VI secretion system baseplate subunit TssG [Paraburkholderia ginsengiterrae]